MRSLLVRYRIRSLASACILSPEPVILRSQGFGRCESESPPPVVSDIVIDAVATSFFSAVFSFFG